MLISWASQQAGFRTPAWQPSDLGADLLGFWDAEVVASVTLAGSLVTTWTDQVGGYAATQATASFKPVYSATSLNGRPGVAFDGTDDFLRTAAIPASFPVGAVGSEIWGLASQDFPGTQAGNQVLSSYGDTSNLNARTIRRINVANVNRGAVAVTAGAATDTVTDLSGIHVLRGEILPASVSISVDGGAKTTAAFVPATAAAGGVVLGALTTGSNRFWKGPFNAVLVTNPLSAANAALLLAFLKTRGGIA